MLTLSLDLIFIFSPKKSVKWSKMLKLYTIPSKNLFPFLMGQTIELSFTLQVFVPIWE
jgi:hypothetical protein